MYEDDYEFHYVHIATYLSSYLSYYGRNVDHFGDTDGIEVLPNVITAAALTQIAGALDNISKALQKLAGGTDD